MKKTLIMAAALMVSLAACNAESKQQTPVKAEGQDSAMTTKAAVAPDEQPKSDIPAGAAAVIKAYPDFQLTYHDNKIWFKDGTGIVYDDGKQKNFEQKLDDSDIEDMFAIPYDRGDVPAYQADGGRSRSEALYKKMYGKTEAEVRKHLVTIDWFGQKLRVTSVNGVDKALKGVAQDVAKHPELKQYMAKSSSFYWRQVRGANRLSAHSYGMTVDVNTSYSDYWRWSGGAKDENSKVKYKNRIPKLLVEIFEKHGFIWGGHWYHYDTMHFEYRPDILIYHGVMK